MKSLNTNQIIELCKALLTGLSILITALISIAQIKNIKQKEIDLKIHEQRKSKYEELLKMIQTLFISGDQVSKGKFPFDRKKWFDIQMGLMIYGSENVFKKYLDIMYNSSLNIPEEDRGNQALVSLGQMILLMRKEVGFNDDKLTIRECLSTIVNDINDTKYDSLFKKYKY